MALHWNDFDVVAKTLRIERPIEDSPRSRAVKEPRTARGIRTIGIAGALITMLSELQEKYLRLVAGVGPDDPVDLSLVRLPDDPLIFPSPIERSV